MSARDSLETETRVVDAPDAPREIVEAENEVESPRGEVLDDPELRREATAESRQRVDGDWEPRRFEAPREELGRFDLKRAGLPDMSIDSAAKYIDEHRDSRPWLAMADRASPEVRRIIAAMDAVGGHAHIRHEGWVSEEANRRRVAYREDPAQLDPEKRHQGTDGVRPNDQLHRSGDIASRIADPDAFATAFARGVQHPKVRAALEMPFDAANRPDQVTVPIAEILGPKGHKYCTGWQLEPGDGSMDTARKNRAAWVKARAEGRTADGPGPQAAPVRTFEGGEIVFPFTRNNSEQRYEVGTMFVQPQLTDGPLSGLS